MVKEKHYAGIDLHSNNSLLAVIDENDKKLFKKKLKNNLSEILLALDPFKPKLEGVVIESTYNWYWLADGLIENDFKVRLANPAAIKQYEGLKYSDDETDAFHLANLLRLGILQEGYIYPKDERPIRDLLRKRLILVRQRTTHILSFKNLVAANLGMQIKTNDVKRLTEQDIENMFSQKHLVTSGKINISMINFLKKQISEIEKQILKEARLRDEYHKLLTVPGIGKILALTIMLETGEINRFKGVGNFVSYARCVKSQRLSNGKVKGQGNRKNGNKYLSWAFVEAANFAIRSYPYINDYYQKKAAKTNKIVAIKAISHKLARACFWILKNQEEFDPKRAFGQ